MGPGNDTSRATSGALSPMAAKVRPRPSSDEARDEARRSANIIAKMSLMFGLNGTQSSPATRVQPCGCTRSGCTRVAALENSQLAACKTLAKKSKASRSRLSIAQFANGPKRSMGHVLGAKRNNFLIRDTDDDAVAGVSVEFCQFVVRRSPGGRLGSVLDVGNRLRRMHRCFQQWIHISTGPQQYADNYHDPPKFWIQSSLESPKLSRMRSRGPPDPRPLPEGVREPIYIRKK